MPRSIMLSSFHLRVMVPDGLSEQTHWAMARALTSQSMQARLRRAAEAQIRTRRPLAKARVVLER